MARWECWVEIKIGFPLEVEAEDEYEAEDIANEELEEIVRSTYRLKKKLDLAAELYEPEDYGVISCELVEE